MPSSNFVVSGLSDYVENNKDLIIKNFALVGTATRQRIGLQTGVKTSAYLHYLELAPTLQDGKGCGFSAAGTATLTQRQVTTAIIKVNMDICPDSLLGKYAEYLVKIGANSEDLPFEKYIVDGIIIELNKKIEKLIWQGDHTQSSDTDIKWIDGLIYQFDNDAAVVDVALANGTAIYNGMKRDVWLHIPYVGADGNPIHWNSPEESDVLACERWLAVEGDVVRSWISIYTGVGAITAPTGVSERTTPFWGVWASASQDLNEALAFAREADMNGFAVEVFLTTDWDNLNSNPWYVVSLGCPDSEGTAQALLAQAQDAGYSDAYIKYSGSYIG